MRHKKYERQRQRVAATLGKTLIFMVVFILIKKKEAIFLAQARPLSGGDGTTAQSRCTDPV